MNAEETMTMRANAIVEKIEIRDIVRSALYVEPLIGMKEKH